MVVVAVVDTGEEVADGDPPCVLHPASNLISCVLHSAGVTYVGLREDVWWC